MSKPRTLQDFALDGVSALEFVIEGSAYRTLVQAVASLTLFTHPDTVRQTRNEPLFRIVRGPNAERGQIEKSEAGPLALRDDNTGPTDAFLWANGLKRSGYKHVQFCHVWQRATDPASYTNLANICVMPAFLAKLSDTHQSIPALLRGRAYQLFGWVPAGESRTADVPIGQNIVWADPLPPVSALETVLRLAMSSKPKSRTTKSAKEIGWLYSNWEPDRSL